MYDIHKQATAMQSFIYSNFFPFSLCHRAFSVILITILTFYVNTFCWKMKIIIKSCFFCYILSMKRAFQFFSFLLSLSKKLLAIYTFQTHRKAWNQYTHKKKIWNCHTQTLCLMWFCCLNDENEKNINKLQYTAEN